jgi:hypothetical protein
MSRANTLQSMFKRYKRPGDIVFAWFVLIISLFLLSQLFDQTAWKAGAKLPTQPRFWPAVSLGGMALFAIFHLISSALSERIDGRWQEVGLWISSLEFAAWFIIYAMVVPYAGYLPSTIVFAVALSWCAGYHSVFMLSTAGIAAFFIVLLFKTFLKVNLPAGRVYEALPDGLRQFMLTYF